MSETKASVVKKKAAALKLKHKLAAEAAAIAVAEHERSARQAANAAAPAEEGYLVPPIDRPTLWERFCRWLKNDAS